MLAIGYLATGEICENMLQLNMAQMEVSNMAQMEVSYRNLIIMAYG